jgi:peptidoglycan/LPS O-acetylase OafA/YrhL
MNSPNRFYFPELDTIRFVAFALVFVHHIKFPKTLILSQISTIGWIGVDLFFCLSAFLLTKLIAKEIEQNGQLSIKYFFIRRILRIWPLYFSFVLLAIVFFCVIEPEFFSYWPRMVGLLTFTENFTTAWSGYNPILFTGHLWTISYEEQFYMVIPFLIPFLIRLTPQGRIFVFSIIFLAGWTIRFILIQQEVKHPVIYTLPFTHFESLVVGVMLGFADLKRIKSAIVLLILVASCIAIVILPGSGVIGVNLMLLYPAVGIFSGSVLVFTMNSSWPIFLKLVRFKPFLFLGKISFGLYVFHSFTIYLTGYIFFETNTYWQAIIAFLVTVIVASASYYILELRFLKMKSKYSIVPSKPV